MKRLQDDRQDDLTRPRSISCHGKDRFFIRRFAGFPAKNTDDVQRGRLARDKGHEDEVCRLSFWRTSSQRGSTAWSRAYVLRLRVYVRRSTSWSVQQEACCPGLD